jgi:hypothetical protein
VRHAAGHRHHPEESGHYSATELIIGGVDISTCGRPAGALGGIRFAINLSGWLAHRPVDPAGRLAASWHSYDKNMCRERSCWDTEIAPVAAAVPLIAAEIGQMDCDSDYAGTPTRCGRGFRDHLATLLPA